MKSYSYNRPGTSVKTYSWRTSSRTFWKNRNVFIVHLHSRWGCHKFEPTKLKQMAICALQWEWESNKDQGNLIWGLASRITFIVWLQIEEKLKTVHAIKVNQHLNKWTNSEERAHRLRFAIMERRNSVIRSDQIQWEHSLGFMVRHTYICTRYQKHQLPQTQQNHFRQVLADPVSSARSVHSAHCGLARLNRRLVGDVI